MRGVFLDFDTVSSGDLQTARLDASLSQVQYFGATRVDQVVERAASADVVMLNKIAMDHGILSQLSQLKLVVLAATGTDSIELDAAAKQGIAVYNIRGYCTASVVQHVFGLILSLTQHLGGYRSLVSEGAWRDATQFCLLDFPIRELCGKKLGVVGYGELGRGVAHVAAAFGMEVLLANRPEAAPLEGRVALEQLLPVVDVLSLHCPLTQATNGMIGAKQLSLMKTEALLINTARGALVDEQALANALRAGRLGGAGIDVLSTEPPTDSNPLLLPGIPNLIVTPHIAWAAREARQRALDQMAANIDAFCRGEAGNRVV